METNLNPIKDFHELLNLLQKYPEQNVKFYRIIGGRCHEFSIGHIVQSTLQTLILMIKENILFYKE